MHLIKSLTISLGATLFFIGCTGNADDAKTIVSNNLGNFIGTECYNPHEGLEGDRIVYHMDGTKFIKKGTDIFAIRYTFSCKKNSEGINYPVARIDSYTKERKVIMQKDKFELKGYSGMSRMSSDGQGLYSYPSKKQLSRYKRILENDKAKLSKEQMDLLKQILSDEGLLYMTRVSNENKNLLKLF